MDLWEEKFWVVYLSIGVLFIRCKINMMSG